MMVLQGQGQDTRAAPVAGRLFRMAHRKRLHTDRHPECGDTTQSLIRACEESPAERLVVIPWGGEADKRNLFDAANDRARLLWQEIPTVAGAHCGMATNRSVAMILPGTGMGSVA